MSTRRRLKPEDRRRELVEVGAVLFAERPYDDVVMDEVADRAGVSRALLYRYFSSKRDLFAAVYRLAAEQLIEATHLAPGVPLRVQVAAGLDVHLDYFLDNRHTVLAANRVLSGDPIIQAIISDELAELRRRLLDVGGFDGGSTETVAAVLTSWLVFVRTISVEWLATTPCPRDVLRDICLGALLGALEPTLASTTGARPRDRTHGATTR